MNRPLGFDSLTNYCVSKFLKLLSGDKIFCYCCMSKIKHDLYGLSVALGTINGRPVGGQNLLFTKIWVLSLSKCRGPFLLISACVFLQWKA